MRMPIAPKHYAAKADEIERLAATISDSAIKSECLAIAAELRSLAQPPEPTDKEVEQLVERMIGGSPSKL
jgi:hypothetical protein